MDDANARATGPRPSPGTCAAAGIARGDPACQTARTVRSCQPCTGRESDSPGPAPHHARCRSYRTGKRRLSLGSRPKEWTACAGGQEKNSGPFPQSRLVAHAAAGSGQHLNITPRLRPKIGEATHDHHPAQGDAARSNDHMHSAAQVGCLTLLRSRRCASNDRRPAAPSLDLQCPRRILTWARRPGPTSPDHYPRHIGGYLCAGVGPAPVTDCGSAHARRRVERRSERQERRVRRVGSRARDRGVCCRGGRGGHDMEA